jgi:hypothetical protein
VEVGKHDIFCGRRPDAMQGSNLVFIVLPNVIPAVLFMGVALPFIADSRSGSRPPSGPLTCDAVGKYVDAQAPDQELLVRAPASQPIGSHQRDLLPQATPAGAGRSR